VDTFSVLAWRKGEIGFVLGVLVLILGVSGLQLRVGQMKTRDAQRKADVELVGRALTVYLEDHQILPAAAEGRIAACGYLRSEGCEWGRDAIADGEGVVYLKKLPIDPFDFARGWKYVYSTNKERTKYKICVNLEYKADKQFKNDIQCNWYAGN